MRGLEQLNPFNHLFGRIFIGFWLLILMLFGAAAWVFLHFDDDGDRKPANLKQVEKVVILGKELQNAIDSGRFNSLKGAVSSTAKATRSNLVVVNLLNENVIYSMREREQPAPQHIIDLSVFHHAGLDTFHWSGTSHIQRTALRRIYWPQNSPQLV